MDLLPTDILVLILSICPELYFTFAFINKRFNEIALKFYECMSNRKRYYFTIDIISKGKLGLIPSAIRNTEKYEREGKYIWSDIIRCLDVKCENALKIVQFCLSKKLLTSSINICAANAYFEDQIKIFNYLNTRTTNNMWSILADKATIEGNLDKFKVAFHRVDDFSVGNLFRSSCYCGKIKIAEYLYSHYPYVLRLSINDALASSCSGGHLDAAKWCVEKGATDFNGGMVAACNEGHQKIADWCVENGANDFNTSLYEATKGSKLHMVKWCIEKKATRLNKSIDLSIPHDLEIFRYLCEVKKKWGKNITKKIIKRAKKYPEFWECYQNIMRV